MDPDGDVTTLQRSAAPAGFLSADQVALSDGSVWNLSTSRVSGGLASVISHAGRVAMSATDLERRTSDRGRRACTSGLRPRDGRLLWRSCDWIVLRYSPDGRHALAARNDKALGLGHTSGLAVLDAATGKVLVDYEGEFMTNAAWESADALLVLTSQDGSSGDHVTYTLVRCDLAGRCSRAGTATGPLTWEDRFGSL